jgi:hypothetical protein
MHQRAKTKYIVDIPRLLASWRNVCPIKIFMIQCVVKATLEAAPLTEEGAISLTYRPGMAPAPRLKPRTYRITDDKMTIGIQGAL